MENLKVIIVGGGIGGITSALCLAKYGFDITVFEQSEAVSTPGAGIQLSPNCSRVLHHLGLEKALKGCAFLPEATQFRHWRTGKVIGETPLGAEVAERFGAPYYHIHRGDLLQVLMAALKECPTVTLKTGIKISDFSQDETGVQVSFDDTVIRADLLIGADGIHSNIHSLLWGDSAPRYTGNVAWRLLVPANRLPEGLIKPMSTAWWGPGKHFVHYYVRQGELVNCVCVVEKAGWDVESWTERGDLHELRSDFAGWHSTIQSLIHCADEDSIYKWALYDRAPMSRWGQGRVTLLGDACHPTLPFMAQGAAMAIEDAMVLANCLDTGTEVAASLNQYEHLRHARTAWIQNGSRRNATLFHLSGVKAWFRDLAAQSAGQRAMDKLFGYNALR